MEPGFTAPVDRYSFGILKTDWDNLSSGVSQDFGLEIFFDYITPNTLRVKYVEPYGPAGLAGVQRGWQITAINGDTNIDTSSASITNIVNGIYNSSSSSITFKKGDGTSTTVALNAATYQTKPVLLDTVYTLPSENVGYLVLNSFLGDSTQIANDFAATLNKFQAANVSDVIVDLRYNGGGYVSWSQQLANMLAPTKANGQTMFTYQYNDKYTSYNTTTNFSGAGSLNLNRIFFIASDGTASASELLINNLTPFLPRQIVGFATQTGYHTYGKPVGFFNISDGDYYVFPISFRTINNVGTANYFNGFPFDKSTYDGLDKNWGDLQENCLAHVMYYIQNGAYNNLRALPNESYSGAVLSAEKADKLKSKRYFNGAVSTNIPFKIIK
jgi:hypothetical protein